MMKFPKFNLQKFEKSEGAQRLNLNVKLEVLPKIQGYPIFFQFLQTWSTEDKIWEELESELDFYKNNVIRLDKNWEDAKHDYEIERQEGMEWTRNMHPNVEGHKWFSHTIIEQIH